MTQAKPFCRKVGGIHFFALGHYRLSFCRARQDAGNLPEITTTRLEAFGVAVMATAAAAALVVGLATAPLLPAAMAQPEDATEAAIVDHAEGCFNDTLLGSWEDARPCLDEIGQGEFIDYVKTITIDCGTDGECLALTVEAFCEWRAARMGW